MIGGKRIIVLGLPRSGTGYISKLLQNNKYDVLHEEMGLNGTSDWRLVSSYERKPNDFVIHIVRNPLDVLASISFTVSYNAITKLKEETGTENDHMMSMVAEIMRKWTDKITEIKPDQVIRVEDLPEELHLYDGDLPKNYNSRPHPKVTLINLEPKARDIISGLMKEFNYKQ